MSADATLAWYERHADEFAARTAAVDMRHLYAPFLERVPPGGRVLDAGCGSGRDAAAFLARSYRVVAAEPCGALARHAEALLGEPVLRLRFDEMRFDAEFDGVWACASLLHVARPALPHAVAACVRALRPGGVLFASFKHGRWERERDGRRFTDLDERGWAEVASGLAKVATASVWTTADARPSRALERWLNVLALRSATTDRAQSGPADPRHPRAST